MATNKSCPKDQFGWSKYRKARRRLSEPQMQALREGHLRPLLDYALAHREVRLDIRPGRANIYFGGGSLLRLQGRDREHFEEIFDSRYIGGGGAKSSPLKDAEDVARLVAALPERQAGMQAHDTAGHRHEELRCEQSIARANDARTLAEAGGFVVFDVEYGYARIRFDFVFFDMRELPRPRLLLAELKCSQGALGGTCGLKDHGTDFVALLRAGGGEHIERIRGELGEVIEQKKRLGLLAADLPFEGFSPEPPRFFIVFAGYDAREPSLSHYVVPLLEAVGQHPSQLDLLRFVQLPRADDPAADLRLYRERVLDVEAFEAYRQTAVQCAT